MQPELPGAGAGSSIVPIIGAIATEKPVITTWWKPLRTGPTKRQVSLCAVISGFVPWILVARWRIKNLRDTPGCRDRP